MKKLYLAHAFIVTCGLLLFVGMMFLYSSSSFYALERYGSSFYMVKKQLCIAVVGIVLASIGYFSFQSLFQNDAIKKYIPSLFFILLIIVIYTKFFGISVNGSRRWLDLVIFRVQPVEFFKVLTVLYVASYCDKYRGKMHLLDIFVSLAVLIAISLTFIRLQPDFGSCIIIFAVVLILLFIAGSSKVHLSYVVIFSCLIGFISILRSPYILTRIKGFINGVYMPLGGSENGVRYQVSRSIMEIGHGGLLGRGLGKSHFKLGYIPEAHTDFIFSTFANETGFIGVLFLIGLYVCFGYFGFSMARAIYHKTYFGFLAINGIISLIFIQIIFHMFVCADLCPTKGLVLPFFSSGGSALITLLLSIAIILKIYECNK